MKKPIEMADWGFIEYFRKSWENSADPDEKKLAFKAFITHEAERDYFTSSLRHVNHLIQIGKPYWELKEPRCEMYKISISYLPVGSKSTHSYYKLPYFLSERGYDLLGPYF